MQISLVLPMFLVGLVLIVGIYVGLGYSAKTMVEKRWGTEDWRSGLVALLFWLLGTVILFSITDKRISFDKPVVVAAEVALLVVVAAVLFWVKTRDLRMYSILEFVFAVSFAVQTVLGQSGPVVTGTQATTLIGCVYLMIRGMDNFKKDWDERKKLIQQPSRPAA